MLPTPGATPAILPGCEKAPPPIAGRDTCETLPARALLAQRGIPCTYLKVDEEAAADTWIRRLNAGGSPPLIPAPPSRHPPRPAVG